MRCMLKNQKSVMLSVIRLNSLENDRALQVN